LERDGGRSEADHGRQPAPINNDNHTSRISRSPSPLAEPAPLAEYQEWPFQGFLKRTRIGNETTYNLEFQLPCISERLNLPVPRVQIASHRFYSGGLSKAYSTLRGHLIFQDPYYSVATSDKACSMDARRGCNGD
jgi:hypothetical protein